MREVLKHILMKASSGRWILTIIAGGVFAYAVYKRILPDAAVAAILVGVFDSYFYRQDRKKGDEK